MKLTLSDEGSRLWVAAYLDVPGIIRIAQALFNLIIGINTYL